jgi:hypothetical protein
MAVFADPLSLAEIEISHSHDWFAIMEKLARLGSVGGLCGPTDKRSEVLMRILSTSDARSQQFQCEFEIGQLSTFAAQALANVMFFFNVKVCQLASVVIFTPPKMSPDFWQKVNRFTGQLPFEVQDERTYVNGGFNIEVQLRTHQTADVLSQIEDAYGHWFSAVNLGCFASETYPPATCFIYPGKETRLRDDSILISIDNCMFSEPEGTDSLLSVFQWVDLHVAEIANIAIYE